MADLVGLFNLLAPFFGLIGLGFLCGKVAGRPEAGLAWMQFFLIYVALPCLFYTLISDKPLDELANGPFILTTTLCTAIVFAISCLVGLWSMRGNIPQAVMQGVAGSYSNIGYMGPPLILSAIGPAASAPVALIFVFDSVFLFSVVPLLMAVAGVKRRHWLATAGEVAWKVATHPFNLATAAGVLGSFLHLQLPAAADRIVTWLSGAAAPCALFGGGVEVEHADLRGEDDETVVGHPVARRAQAVAVEDRADLRAVGEDDARGTVPGLHQRGVELVERARPASISVWFSHASGIIISTECGSDRPPRCSSSSTSSKDAESEAPGVQIGKIRSRSPGIRSEVEQRLAGPHPVAVAHHRVDLAVVGDEPERVRQRPARERVGGEPRVDDGQGGGHPLVDQVGEEAVELVGGEHPLVDEGARRQRREVGVGLLLGPLAQAEGAALQRHPGHPLPGAGHEQLAEGGHHASGRSRPAASGSMGTSRQPRTVRPSSVGELLDPAGGSWRPAPRRRAGSRADGVRVRRRAARSRRRGDRAQERVGHLQQDPRAVAGVGLGARGAAVVEVAERGQRLRHDAWLASPVRVATKATPQASCSCRGRTDPGAAGMRAQDGSRRRRATRSRVDVVAQTLKGAQGTSAGQRQASGEIPSLTRSLGGRRRSASWCTASDGSGSRASVASRSPGSTSRGPGGWRARPHEVRRGQHEQHDRGPHVEPQAPRRRPAGRVDAQVSRSSPAPAV